MLQFVLRPTDYRGPVAGNCLGKGGAPATVCALGQIITNSPLGHFFILLFMCECHSLPDRDSIYTAFMRVAFAWQMFLQGLHARGFRLRSRFAEALLQGAE
mgnify:FL=1